MKSSARANLLKAVEKQLAELRHSLPTGMSDSIPFNTAPFVKVSIDKVIQTLIEAMVLVFCVMFLFLQNIRYTFIPAIAAPIALLGTFSIMLVTGFSINVLTIFGMVLAIGIIVDNAIVVVENVERLMSEKGLSPQADASARMQIDDVLQLYVRNSNGGMVALSEFVTPSWRETSPQFIRFQGYPALLMSGSAASGVSSGEAMAEVERLAKQLPPGFTMVWTGQSLQERQSASLAPMLMTMSSSRQRTRTSNDDGTSTQ